MKISGFDQLITLIGPRKAAMALTNSLNHFPYVLKGKTFGESNEQNKENISVSKSLPVNVYTRPDSHSRKLFPTIFKEKNDFSYTMYMLKRKQRHLKRDIIDHYSGYRQLSEELEEKKRKEHLLKQNERLASLVNKGRDKNKEEDKEKKGFLPPLPAEGLFEKHVTPSTSTKPTDADTELSSVF